VIDQIKKKSRKMYENLIISCSTGNLVDLNRLLEQGVNPSQDGNVAISIACLHGHLDVVNRLLQPDCLIMGVNPSALGNLAIIWASENGHLDVVNRLLQETDSGTRKWEGANDILEKEENRIKILAQIFSNSHLIILICSFCGTPFPALEIETNVNIEHDRLTAEEEEQEQNKRQRTTNGSLSIELIGFSLAPWIY